MAKYRKRPIVVDAEQWQPGKFVEGVVEYTGYGLIKTTEGRMLVRPGDWIIVGVAGEHYPCRDDIFQQTYETVEGA